MNIKNQDNFCFIYCYMLHIILERYDVKNNRSNLMKRAHCYKFEIHGDILHLLGFG